MVKRHTIMLVSAIALMAAPVHAKKNKRKKPKAAQVHHAPPAVAEAHEALQVEAQIDDVDRLERAVLVYRKLDERKFHEARFRRTEGHYVAEIPADVVQAPGVAYSIEVVDRDAKRRSVFSSRKSPHVVSVPDDAMDLIEEASAKRLGDRRSAFGARGEFVSFGDSVAQIQGPNGTLVDRVVDDHYYRIEGSYTYRPLRTIAEFSIRVGVIRGRAPVAFRDPLPGQSEDERFDVGLNYGAPSVRFRLGEHWHIDGGMLANVTEVGFSVGTDAALHIGDIRGSKVTFGFEAIQTFGLRFYTQVDIQAVRWLKLSPIVEVTNMPNADDYGVRLLGETTFDIGWGIALAGRGGYQARDFQSGGFSAGGAATYGF